MQAQSPDITQGSAAGTSPHGEVESPLHEHSHVRLRGLIWFFVCFFAAGILIHIGVYLVFLLYREQASQQYVPITGLQGSAAQSTPPRPWLQPSVQHDILPREDLAQNQQRDLQQFRQRGWVDEHGNVRVDEKTANQVIQLSQTLRK